MAAISFHRHCLCSPDAVAYITSVSAAIAAVDFTGAAPAGHKFRWLSNLSLSHHHNHRLLQPCLIAAT